MLADQRAALDVERERGEAHDLFVVAPTGLEKCKVRCRPRENFAPLARLVHEQEQLAAQRVALQPVRGSAIAITETGA